MPKPPPIDPPDTGGPFKPIDPTEGGPVNPRPIEPRPPQTVVNPDDLINAAKVWDQLSEVLRKVNSGVPNMQVTDAEFGLPTHPEPTYGTVLNFAGATTGASRASYKATSAALLASAKDYQNTENSHLDAITSIEKD